MSNANSSQGGLKPTLGLLGVTINAMALIAPGAFLWTTFQLQSPTGPMNMWASIALATVIALLTASCYATLSKAYPDAGAGSSYYYAEAAILAKEEHIHFRFARIVKFLTGWTSHLYYWVYPGVMVAFMGTLIVYIGQLFNPDFASDNLTKMLLCAVFAALVGAIAFRGVSGSTLVNIIINVIQITSLTLLGLLFIAYRLGHGTIQYAHDNAISVIVPHDFSGLIYQTTIAILLLVGFESATALAGEAINPHRDIPRGVMLSLFIQACICYFFEYFAANFFMNNQYQGVVDKAGSNFAVIPPEITSFSDPKLAEAIGATFQQTYAGGKIVQGFDAAAASGAPIGDMTRILGDSLFGTGAGFWLTLALAITVLLALIGTTLSSLSTGVRISYAMSQDRELPTTLGHLHRQHSTPHFGIIILTLVSAAIGAYGVLSVDNLTQITLISNIGTFIFYGLTCLITLVASLDHLLGEQTNVWQTIVIPLAGAVLNFLMMFGVFYYGLTAGGATGADATLAIGVSIAFFVTGFVYLIGNSLIRGKRLLLPPDANLPTETEMGSRR